MPRPEDKEKEGQKEKNDDGGFVAEAANIRAGNKATKKHKRSGNRPECRTGFPFFVYSPYESSSPQNKRTIGFFGPFRSVKEQKETNHEEKQDEGKENRPSRINSFRDVRFNISARNVQ